MCYVSINVYASHAKSLFTNWTLIKYTHLREFDKVYGPAWHCIVGSSFGSFVTHATGCFLYFSMEKLYILVFKTKVQKTVKFSP
ncbi:putative dynein ATPase [Helianthus annuus]|nr:putative dynein ATPase [Helianthus annuus]KAJ0606543.1 putative dynein ATPase [Helianthus annuus]KAJ0766630.1 putative dynein ATPase [Helianthus annuus]KAJ0772533.1 putative dynein ATPase [Helianthus annuus]KAJ0933878.1 putative dynein ATPase [Helianthus annuus]